MKKLNFLFVLITIISLGITGIIFLYSSDIKFSKEEGRNLTEKTKLIWNSNQSMKMLESYYKDHFLFRKTLLEQGTNIKRNLGIKIQNNVYIGKDEYLFEVPKENMKSAEFIKNVNDFYKKHNSINMSMILLPSHITINPEKAPKNVPIFDEYHEIKSIYHQLTVNTVDAVSILKEGLKDYPMYYRLDTNLTSYGAYYIYKEYAKSNDLDELPITSFEIEEVSHNFSGNLVKKAYTFSYEKDSVVKFVPKQDIKLEVSYEDRKEITLYNENAKEDNFYEYFPGSKESLIEITNLSIDNKKEILILKDESANVIISFFINHFYKVHVIDIDSYDQSISGYLDTHEYIKDLVFIYKMNGLDHKSLPF